MSTREPTILATGFSVFPGAPENPTALAIEALESERWQPRGARLVTRVLPVRYDVFEDEFAPLLAREKPDAVVAFGLSAKAIGFTLESTARNQLGVGRPDAAGVVAQHNRLSDRGAPIYPTGLPLGEISRALTERRIPQGPSDDAGDYICNLVFYRLMAQSLTSGSPRIAGFIHLPYLGEQLPRLERAGLQTGHLTTLTRAQLMDGVRAILGVVTDAVTTLVRD